MVGGDIRREQKIVSDGRRHGSDFGYGQLSGEQRTPCRHDAGSVFWDRDGGRQGGRMIPIRVVIGSVGEMVRRRTIL